MKTATKGNEAEAMILAALVGRGYDVSVPFGGGQPYDLVIDLGGFDLLKVQCKTGWWDKSCISFNTRSTDHGQGRRSYVGLAHIFAVYFPPRRSVHLVPLDAVGGFGATCDLSPPATISNARSDLPRILRSIDGLRSNYSMSSAALRSWRNPS